MIQDYFKMHKALCKETQFNRKVELNIKINEFKKRNGIEVLNKSGVYDAILINGTKMGAIYPVYNKKGEIYKYNYKDEN